jgi:hypothetical protein
MAECYGRSVVVVKRCQFENVSPNVMPNEPHRGGDEASEPARGQTIGSYRLDKRDRQSVIDMAPPSPTGRVNRKQANPAVSPACSSKKLAATAGRHGRSASKNLKETAGGGSGLLRGQRRSSEARWAIPVSGYPRQT